MFTLTTIQKAPILDEAGLQIKETTHDATSADAAVATIVNLSDKLYVSAAGLGTTTISAVRSADGATASLEVTVVETAVPFAITLGAPVPK